MLCIRAGGKAYTVAWRDCILCAIIDMPLLGLNSDELIRISLAWK